MTGRRCFLERAEIRSTASLGCKAVCISSMPSKPGIAHVGEDPRSRIG